MAIAARTAPSAKNNQNDLSFIVASIVFSCYSGYKIIPEFGDIMFKKSLSLHILTVLDEYQAFGPEKTISTKGFWELTPGLPNEKMLYVALDLLIKEGFIYTEDGMSWFSFPSALFKYKQKAKRDIKAKHTDRKSTIALIISGIALLVSLFSNIDAIAENVLLLSKWLGLTQ